MKIPIPKQVEILQRNLAKVFNYQVYTLTLNEDGSIYVVIEPSDGYWKGGRFPFSISFNDDLPHYPPIVTNLDKEIAHPNITMGGVVCLNILSEEWDSSFGIADIIQGLLFLFYEPAFDNALTDKYIYIEDYPIRESIERQINKRLALLDEENGYIMSLVSSILSEVVNSQVQYKEIQMHTNPL